MRQIEVKKHKVKQGKDIPFPSQAGLLPWTLTS